MLCIDGQSIEKNSTERGTHMKRFRSVAILFFVLALVAAACSSDDSTDTTAGGTETTAATSGGSGGDTGFVEIFGPETATELLAFQDAMQPWEDETGATVLITGDRSFQELNDVRMQGGNPPDIAIYAQPGKIQDLAARGDILPLPDDLAADLLTMFDPFWLELVTYEGKIYGIPQKSDLKSLVWYSPTAFAANGYTIPETWAELETLMDTMKADGETPWCIGIGSGGATGWPYTDWMEDIMLRLHGPEVYDQWVNHEIPFDDPKVIEVGNFINDLWGGEGNVFGGRETIASTDFGDSGLPLLEGKCMMHRQANFYANFWVDPGRSGSDPETVLGPDGDVNVFYLPTISDDFGTVVLGAGAYATMMQDRPEVVSAMTYIGGPTYAETRTPLAPGGGFLSPNTAQDVTVSFAGDPFGAALAAILLSADPFRFDASDLMPGDIGSGQFWSSATDITAGNVTVEEGFAKVEEVWAGLG
jgi:alpha-glucoside transport system substrate-binding protein